MKWHFGLGRELGLVLWALALFEAAYGAYSTVWSLWIEHLGAPIEVVGLVLASMGVVRPFVLVWGTRFVENTNVRRFLMAMRGISIAGMVFAAFATRWELLLVTCCTYAFGDLVFPTLHAHVSQHGQSNFIRAYSLTCTIAPSIAMIFTPLIAGAVIQWGGMRASLLLSAGFSFLGMLCIRFMDFSHIESRDVPQKHGTYRETLRQPSTRDIMISFFGTIFVLGIGAMLLPNYLQDQRGLSPQMISILTTGMAIGTALAGLTSIKITAIRKGPFRAATLGTLCASLGFFLFMVTDDLPLIALAMVLRGGMFAAWTFFLAAIGQYTPRHLQTRAFSIIEILGGGALAFSPALAGVLYEVDPTLPLALAGSCGLAVAALTLIRDRRGFTSVISAVPEIERESKSDAVHASA